MGTKRLLVIPHVGTAYGHLIRVGELLNTRYGDCDEIFVSIPKSAFGMAKLHMPVRVKFLTYGIRPTVTSRGGKLDVAGFLKLVELDRRFGSEIQPSLIIGDPGIRAGLLGERMGIPWEALMHGCYLPMPEELRRQRSIVSSNIGRLAKLAWNLAQTALDQLVRLGSTDSLRFWSELRQRGRILIPNSPEAEPCDFGVHTGDIFPRLGFSAGREFPCVVTLCSSGDVAVPPKVLQQLVRLYGEVAVIGPARECLIRGVRFLGTRFATQTVVGKGTIVICHGGHGTLKAVKQAQRVIVVPGDIDQLCNALIAFATWQPELVVGQSWVERLNSDTPFRRIVDWNELVKTLTEESSKALESNSGRFEVAASSGQILSV